MGDPDVDDSAIRLRVDRAERVHLTWRPGLHIDAGLARRAMAMVDELNGAHERPLLVDMTGTAQVTRDARTSFGRECSATRVALLGGSEVDRVIANIALAITRFPVPTRYFTSKTAALAWLDRTDAER